MSRPVTAPTGAAIFYTGRLQPCFPQGGVCARWPSQRHSRVAVTLSGALACKRPAALEGLPVISGLCPPLVKIDLYWTFWKTRVTH